MLVSVSNCCVTAGKSRWYGLYCESYRGLGGGRGAGWGVSGGVSRLGQEWQSEGETEDSAAGVGHSGSVW